MSNFPQQLGAVKGWSHCLTGHGGNQKASSDRFFLVELDPQKLTFEGKVGPPKNLRRQIFGVFLKIWGAQKMLSQKKQPKKKKLRFQIWWPSWMADSTAMESDCFQSDGFCFCIFLGEDMGVEPKIGYPKMDGLWWKILKKWMIWGENPLFLETPYVFACFWSGFDRWNLWGVFLSDVRSTIWRPQTSQLLPKKTCILVGGWFPNPFENLCSSNGIISPKFRGEHRKYLKFHHLVLVFQPPSFRRELLVAGS